ncbi:MAG: aspartyl protease family protein [Aeromonas veronii]
MPIITARVNGAQMRALVDTGCSRTIVCAAIITRLKRSASAVVAVDGSRVACVGEAMVKVEALEASVDVNCLIC